MLRVGLTGGVRAGEGGVWGEPFTPARGDGGGGGGEGRAGTRVGFPLDRAGVSPELAVQEISRAPTTLDELVEAGYLRGGIPVDPFTGSNETWHVDIEDVPISPEQASAGIVDVHSGSEAISLEGTPYSSW